MSSDKPSDKSDLACPKGEVLVYQTEAGEVKVVSGLRMKRSG